MLTENSLKVGQAYLYWSPSRMKHERVTYVGKRQDPIRTNGKVFVFRLVSSLNEIWTENLINIAVDDGWLEKFVNEKDDES